MVPEQPLKQTYESILGYPFRFPPKASPNELYLFRCPRNLADARIKVIVPSLATLLPCTPGKLSSDTTPLFSAYLVHKIGYTSIILWRPGLLSAPVENLGPAMEALHVRLPYNILRHL